MGSEIDCGESHRAITSRRRQMCPASPKALASGASCLRADVWPVEVVSVISEPMSITPICHGSERADRVGNRVRGSSRWILPPVPCHL